MRRRRTLTIRNFSTYDTDEVKKLVRFAMAPTDPDETIVVVTHTTKNEYSGLAMPYVPYEKGFRPIPASAFYAIRLRVGRAEHFPMQEGYWRYGREKNWDPSGEWPLFRLETWQEALVMIAAHEAKHNEYQRMHNNGTGELRCELYAAQMLQAYRQEGV